MRCGREGLRAPSPQLLSFEKETDVHGGGLVAKWCLTLVTPQTVAHQVSLFVGFFRQEY